MFDNQDNNIASPPSNLPTEPADIFDSVEKSDVATAPNALKSGLLKPKDGLVKDNGQKNEQNLVPGLGYSSPGASETIFVPNKKTGEGNWSLVGKIILGIVGIFGLLAVGYGGWYLYAKLKTINETKISQPTPVESSNSNVLGSNSQTTTSAGKTSEVLFGDADTDGDGLGDSEENSIKTSISNPDTDGDGLSDYDELKIWGTDPLKTDTDSDSYLDGSEIANGYNPKGSGRFTPALPVVRFVTTTGAQVGGYTYVNQVIKTGEK